MKTATCAGGPNLIWLFLIFFTVLFEGKAFIKSVIQSFKKKMKSKILRQHRMQFCENSKQGIPWYFRKCNNFLTVI